MTQTELAERWRISEATLERWRTESNGPLFLKLGNQVRYRVQDVEAFEEVALRGSTDHDLVAHWLSQHTAASVCRHADLAPLMIANIDSHR